MRHVFILLSALLAGCTSSSGPHDGPEIRIANRSDRDFASVLVRFPSDDVHYGAVAAGRATEYRQVDQAYRYAYVEVRVGDDRIVLQPIDFVGETLLSPGRYTYVLTLREGGLQLDLEHD